MTTAVDIPGMETGRTSGIEETTAALSVTSGPDSGGGEPGTATVTGICLHIAVDGIYCQAGRDVLPQEPISTGHSTQQLDQPTQVLRHDQPLLADLIADKLRQPFSRRVDLAAIDFQVCLSFTL